MVVSILGTSYEIKRGTDKDFSKLKHATGLCEMYSKEIIVENIELESMTVNNATELEKKIMRHEIIHAFMFESGLSGNSWADMG